jgi:hypothetical protein
MTHTTHTQGPWFIRKHFNGRGALDLFGEGGQIILGNALLINQEADARLIAAAPDLLDALIKARMWVGQYNNMPGHDAASIAMCNAIDKAINKAKGN